MRSKGWSITATLRQGSEFNLLNPTGNFTYHKFEHSKTLHCHHMESVCFVWFSEQTANFCLTQH